FCGFSLAVSGSTRPLAVVCSSSIARTIRRSPRGLSFIFGKTPSRECVRRTVTSPSGRAALFGTLGGRVPTFDSIYRRSGAISKRVGTRADGLPLGLRLCVGSERRQQSG